MAKDRRDVPRTGQYTDLPFPCALWMRTSLMLCTTVRQTCDSCEMRLWVPQGASPSCLSSEPKVHCANSIVLPTLSLCQASTRQDFHMVGRRSRASRLRHMPPSKGFT